MLLDACSLFHTNLKSKEHYCDFSSLIEPFAMTHFPIINKTALRPIQYVSQIVLKLWIVEKFKVYYKSNKCGTWTELYFLCQKKRFST